MSPSRTEELLRRTFEVRGRDFDKAGDTSAEVKAILTDLGIDPEVILRAGVITFEAEMNVVMYARRGTVIFTLTEEALSIEVTDQGPGIPDIEQAMKDGFTTGGGLGLGLGGAKRLSNEFSIHSRVGEGTRVTITRWK